MLVIMFSMVFCTGCTERGFFVYSGGVVDGMDHFENFDEKTRVDNGDYDSGVNGIIAAGNIESEVELKFCSGGVDLAHLFSLVRSANSLLEYWL
jgi:hypothetical protein